MLIWTVVYGEQSEGGSIFGVYASEEAALGRVWHMLFEDPRVTKWNDWSAVSAGYWEGGCDYIRMQVWVV